MKIKDIKYVNTKETRTDGRYPLRIGSIVDFYTLPSIGCSMCLSYIKDNKGNQKDGILITSLVNNIVETETEISIETMNSIYVLEKEMIGGMYMNEVCGDNRFEMISKAKNHLIESTNIETAADEMKVLDSFLYRCWQMGWLDRYDTSKQ